MINWLAFAVVLVFALVGAVVVVTAYAFGIRLLVASGRPMFVDPAEFTDAITVIKPGRAEAMAKKATKAARRSPLTRGQKRLALVGAYACFFASGAAVLFGIWLIVPSFH